MSYMLTSSGQEHALRPMRYQPCKLEDIAHHLAQINRFNGAAVRPYSVAEHSLLVADLALADHAKPSVQLAALMHDAHEAYIGDVVSPVQWELGHAWAEFEAHSAAHLREQFGLQCAFVGARAKLRRWDLVALATERRDLTAFDPEYHKPWPVIDRPDARIEPSDRYCLHARERADLSWTHWRQAFFDRAVSLMVQVQKAGEASS